MSVVDAIQQVAAWLADPTNGVNAIRGSVPGEAATAIPTITWYDSVTTAWAARQPLERGQITSAWIGVVSRYGDIESGALAEEHTPAPKVPVLVRFAARDPASAAVARIGEQLVRCARRSLSVPFNDSTFADLTRNGVHFDAPTFRTLDLWSQPGDDAVVGALLVLLPTLDAWALGRST